MKMGTDKLISPVTAEMLADIGLFAALDLEVRQHLVDTLAVLSYAPGDVVFHEGESARELFVVINGEFEVLKRSKRGIEARVAILGMGDWFGEMSIVDAQPRSASVRALAQSKLLVVSSADLEALYRRDVKAYALLVLNVARELSRRLRVADGVLADLVTNLVDDLTAGRHGSAT
jgi:CRP-like cAMP-binding protein